MEAGGCSLQEEEGIPRALETRAASEGGVVPSVEKAVVWMTDPFPPTAEVAASSLPSY